MRKHTHSAPQAKWFANNLFSPNELIENSYYKTICHIARSVFLALIRNIPTFPHLLRRRRVFLWSFFCVFAAHNRTQSHTLAHTKQNGEWKTSTCSLARERTCIYNLKYFTSSSVMQTVKHSHFNDENSFVVLAHVHLLIVQFSLCSTVAYRWLYLLRLLCRCRRHCHRHCRYYYSSYTKSTN